MPGEQKKRRKGRASELDASGQGKRYNNMECQWFMIQVSNYVLVSSAKWRLKKGRPQVFLSL